MGKFDGILLCTDLDGTLLRKDKSVSDENIKAIEYFKAEGGYFTFITGRMPYTSAKIYETVKPNVPIGCINGGGVFDFEKDKYLMMRTLPEDAFELVKHIESEISDIGVQVNTSRNIYFTKDNIGLYNFYSFFVAALILCFFIKPKPITDCSKKDKKTIAFCALCSAISLAVVGFVMTTLASSVPSVIMFPLFNGLGIILVCIGSVFVFKEKLSVKKTAGLILGVFGLFLINI